METELSKKMFTHEYTGQYHLFSFTDATYRLAFKAKFFITSLRVNISAITQTGNFYDSFDLYSSRNRTHFAGSASRTCGITTENVERELLFILDYLEKERDKTLSGISEHDETASNAEDKTEALKLLQSPSLFELIAEDMTKTGCIAEDHIKQLLYICASSRKQENPLSVLLIAAPASGKRFLIHTVMDMLPTEETIYLNGLTEPQLNRMDSLTHTALVLTDTQNKKTLLRPLLRIMNEKYVTRLQPKKNEKTGKTERIPVSLPVRAAVIMSATSANEEIENSENCLPVLFNENSEQTRKIQQTYSLKYSLDEQKNGKKERQQILKIHRTAQRLLQKKNIVNEFASFPGFQDIFSHTRYGYARFLDLLAAICFLRQFQKQEQRQNNFTYITCDPDDYRIAYELVRKGILSDTPRELTRGAQTLYKTMHTYAKKQSVKKHTDISEISITQREIRQTLPFGQTWVKVYIKELTELGYVVLVQGGKERERGLYRLANSTDQRQITLSRLPKPEDLRQFFEKKHTLDKYKSDQISDLNTYNKTRHNFGRENNEY